MLLLSLFKISGHSMEPTLSQGQTVLVSSIPFLLSKTKVGDIVLIRHSGLSRISLRIEENERDSGVAKAPQNDAESRFLIKRITKIDPLADGEKYFVSGDNKKDSMDSKDFGWIERKEIVGRVILNFKLIFFICI